MYGFVRQNEDILTGKRKQFVSTLYSQKRSALRISTMKYWSNFILRNSDFYVEQSTRVKVEDKVQAKFGTEEFCIKITIW